VLSQKDPLWYKEWMGPKVEVMVVSNSWLHDYYMGHDWASLHVESEQWKGKPAIHVVPQACRIQPRQALEVVVTFLTSQDTPIFHGKIAQDFLSTYEHDIRD
jgi:hypothetical protein